jgi:hypothetical protein
VFEERLKWNAQRLQRRRFYFHLLLGCALVVYWLEWHSLVLYALLAALIGSGVLICTSEPYQQSSKYVGRVNRALSALYLKMSDNGDRLLFHRNIPRAMQSKYADYKQMYNKRRKA